MVRKKYDASTIIVRAWELGIDLQVRNGRVVAIPGKDAGEVPDRVLSVVEEYHADLLAALLPLCVVCLDAGIEREAEPADFNGFMFCAEHRPVELWSMAS